MCECACACVCVCVCVCRVCVCVCVSGCGGGGVGGVWMGVWGDVCVCGEGGVWVCIPNIHYYIDSPFPSLPSPYTDVLPERSYVRQAPPVSRCHGVQLKQQSSQVVASPATWHASKDEPGWPHYE